MYKLYVSFLCKLKPEDKMKKEIVRALIKRIELEKTTLLSLMVNADNAEYDALNDAYGSVEDIINILDPISKDAEAVDVDA